MDDFVKLITSLSKDRNIILLKWTYHTARNSY